MAKRSSGQYERHEHDHYDTPAEAVEPLIPWLRKQRVRTFAEPCVGRGFLVKHLRLAGLNCKFTCDIQQGPQGDALAQTGFGDVDAIITNPPWDRSVLHPMIEHFMGFRPTWLLFEADWKHTLQAQAFLPHCTHVVSVGRVKWFDAPREDGKASTTGKDNAAWYRFVKRHAAGPIFINKRLGKRDEERTFQRRRWTDAEDRWLVNWLRRGVSLRAIGARLRRNPGVVLRRARHLGLVRPELVRIAA